MEEDKLYIEVECGGPDAAGGGCGAPLNFYKTSQEDFDATKGQVSHGPTNLREDEMWKCFGIDWQGGLIKKRFRPCSECREFC